MRDELVRAITADGLVKAVAVTGRDLVERVGGAHRYGVRYRIHVPWGPHGA